MNTPEQEIEKVEVSVSFWMPLELHRRLKIVAAKEGRTVKEIMNGLVTAWVAKKETE